MAELLALRRAGAPFAQLARWLHIERHAVVVAVTVDRWLDNGPDIEVASDFEQQHATLPDRFVRLARFIDAAGLTA